MKKRITLRQSLFLLPLLLLLAIFAVYPIVTSIIYSLYDYRTNDQTAAGLYNEPRFNAALFYEDCDTIAFFLEDDMTVVGDEDATVIQEVIDGVTALGAPYEAYGSSEGEEKAESVIALGSDEEAAISEKLSELETKLMGVYDRNPNAEFWHGKENMQLLFNEMKGCFIQSNFIGGAAYGKLFTDERFGSSLGTTLIFTVISVFLEFVLGMALALIMNKAIKGIGGVRTVALIPWAIPTAVAALMWSYMYDGSSGVIAQIFANLGFIGAPEQMLLTPAGAMAAAIIADVWKTTPYMALLLLAGLQVIDGGVYESAAIDGAGKVKTFFKITLPLLKPSILVALLFRMLDAFRVYDLIAVLTGGSQGTETLSIYAYKLMIGQSNYGYGSAVVVAMAVCVGIIAFVFVKVLGAELVSDD